MSENDFQPYTPQLGISGSSYQLQMGQVNEFWAIRLVKGTSVLASKVFNDSPEPEELPLGRYLTGWVLSVLAIPNINTYQIQKVVGFLRSKARDNFEHQKEKRQSAGKSERHEVVLEKVPENVQVKRPQSKGWVKEEKPSEQSSQSSSDLSPALAASNRSASGLEPGHTTVGSRKLPPIPHGEGFVIKPLEGAVGAKPSGKSSANKLNLNQIQDKLMHSSEIMKLIEKVENLEKRVKQLEEYNASLQNK